MSQILIALSVWLHALGTVVLIGHYLLLSIIYVPALAKKDGTVLSEISKRSSTGNNGSWQRVASQGFGAGSAHWIITSLTTFKERLYATVESTLGTGAQVWRSSNGVAWVQVVGNGFGDINNIKIESLTTYVGALYAAANNPVTGVEIWRSTDGVNWTQINEDGFGDSSTFVSLWSNGTVVFDGKYLIGSSGPFGGVIWELRR